MPSREEERLKGLLQWWRMSVEDVSSLVIDDVDKQLMMEAVVATVHSEMLENGWLCGLYEEEVVAGVKVENGIVSVKAFSFWNPKNLLEIIQLEVKNV